jgi:hypothetical protein
MFGNLIKTFDSCRIVALQTQAAYTSDPNAQQAIMQQIQQLQGMMV